MSAPVAEPLLPATPADPVGGRRAWVITGLLVVLMMINFADKAVLGLAHDAILADIGISESQYGVISGAFFLLFSVSALAVGFLADHYPTKRLLLWMCLLWTVSVLPLLGPAVGFGLLLGCRIFLGAAEGPTLGVANHAVQKWFRDDQRNVPIALLNLGATLGVIVMARPLTAIIENHGWQAAFATVAALGVAWAMVWAVVGKEGPMDAGSASNASSVTEDAGETGAEPAGSPAGDSRLSGRRVPFARLVLTGTFLGALAGSAAAYWSLSLLLTYANPYLTEALGYASGTASTLYALPWAAAGLVLVGQGLLTRRLMLRGVSTRWARGGVGGVCLLVAALFTVLFVHATDGAAQILCLCVAFSMSGMMFTVSMTVCGEIAPPEQRGSVLGAYVAVASLAGVLAPPVMGRLLDGAATKADGYTTGFTVMAVVLAAGGLLALWLIRPGRDAARLEVHATTVS